LLHIKPAS